MRIADGALVSGVALLSFVAVGVVRGYAIRREILDRPNERSSHMHAVPRGGGLGSFAAFALVAPLAVMRGHEPLELWLCLAAAASVALVGWLDDHGGLSVWLRLVVHSVAGASVAALLYALGDRGLWSVWWLFWTVASINVVNFMDGIDGLVASQCVIFLGAILVRTDASSVSHALALTLLAASLGFLVWNWPPARIFLGDAGSGSLGFLCALIGAMASVEAGLSVVRVFLPLFPLFFDASWTLMRRLRNGERVTQAHRSHLYQRLANGGWGHLRVTLLYSVAAALGATVAVLDLGEGWPFVVVLYVTAVFALAMFLDRLQPFPWACPARVRP